MREMDAANFGRIAGELRMSSADQEALVRQGHMPPMSCRRC